MANDEIDVDNLDPVEEDEDDVNPDKPLLILGLTFSEILAICNALAGFSLAYMALFGRNASRYGGLSFVDSCFQEYFGQEPVFPTILSPFVFLPFISTVLVRFFNESAATMGGSLVMDNLFTLYAAILLSAFLELNRRHVVVGHGRTGKILTALLPLLCQMIGICVVYPLVLAWMWKVRRNMIKAERLDGLPMYDVDVGKVVLACLSAVSVLTLNVFTLKAGNRDLNHSFTSTEVVCFLCAPMIPFLMMLMVPTVPKASSKRVRQIAGILAIAVFLLIGAVGFAVHSTGFTQFEQELKKNGGESVVQLIIKDALSSAPSRFLFVEFVHLELSCVLFCALEMSGSGGFGLIAFVTALVGPAGSFGLLAAHHEFRLMREDKLI